MSNKANLVGFIGSFGNLIDYWAGKRQINVKTKLSNGKTYSKSSRSHAEAYSEPCRTLWNVLRKELTTKPLNIFTKHSILDV